jgi:hypothetical protein
LILAEVKRACAFTLFFLGLVLLFKDLVKKVFDLIVESFWVLEERAKVRGFPTSAIDLLAFAFLVLGFVGDGGKTASALVAGSLAVLLFLTAVVLAAEGAQGFLLRGQGCSERAVECEIILRI